MRPSSYFPCLLEALLSSFAVVVIIVVVVLVEVEASCAAIDLFSA